MSQFLIDLFFGVGIIVTFVLAFYFIPKWILQRTNKDDEI